MSRRKFFHKFVTKYSLSVLIPFFIVFILLQLQIFYTIKLVLPYVEVLEIKGVLIKNMVIVIVVTFIIFLVASVISSIYLHRFSGPITRLIKELKEMQETKKYHFLKVRYNDEIYPLIEEFNNVLKDFVITESEGYTEK